MPPSAKQKIKLSISKPVRLARSNRLGGDQYAGTNNGSVRPKGIVSKLARSIKLRCVGKLQCRSAHGMRNALDQRNHM
jgi:hypothetical protein